jgi:4-aminobutyrate aminotransferase-like enzyme/Ser/Thr protein kinase RdoA (MazF antagonist)
VPSGVLGAAPPRFSPAEVARIARDLFGIDGTATDLGSERDQTFLVDGGGRAAVVKISNSAEDPAMLELESQAIEHLLRVDPGLPVARPLWPADRVVRGHAVRAFERVEGRTAVGSELDDGALRRFGETHARLNRALRGFFHPAARRELLWDLGHAAKLRPLAESIADEGRRRLVEHVLDRYEQRVRPSWPALRAHVVHGDMTLDNVLLDEGGRIAGIVDFGDISHSAEAADLAIGLTSLLRGRAGDDVYRSARLALDGYSSVTPLEPEELELLADLVATRLAALVTISAWRVERFPENAEYIQAWDRGSWALLEQLVDDGLDAAARELGAPGAPVPTGELARRRRSVLGSALTGLTYRRPVHVVRAEGVWLYEAGGGRILDAYNNVPVVGHCHPRVTEAVVQQTRAVNTHARYLYEPLVHLAERLAASMPPGSGLDTVMLVNSGSEANDVAWRIALAATSHAGGIATAHAYHGVTAAVSDLSPEEWKAGYRPEHVRTIAAPGLDAAAAVQELEDAGFGLAATFADTAFTSDGVLVPSAEDLAGLVERTHAAGGLFVADEVQAGHGRTGEHLWSFAAFGVTPDVVTLGKPMGNGYPVAAVIARGDLVDRFAETTDFFSTFGGNPVAARAALAVLDVIEDERLVEHAARVGARLREALSALEHASIRAVRGRGLLAGVELESAEAAERVVDRMRERGVLIGRTGPRENVLKIRPPLVFGDEHVEIVATELERVLGE